MRPTENLISARHTSKRSCHAAVTTFLRLFEQTTLSQTIVSTLSTNTTLMPWPVATTLIVKLIGRRDRASGRNGWHDRLPRNHIARRGNRGMHRHPRHSFLVNRFSTRSERRDTSDRRANTPYLTQLDLFSVAHTDRELVARDFLWSQVHLRSAGRLPSYSCRGEHRLRVFVDAS